MSRGRSGLRDKWRRAVLASDLPDGPKVTLIAKSLWMTDQGYVSVPRETIAELVGKHPRKISEHIALAVRVGFLQKIGGGYRGVTAQYVAVIPTPKGCRLRGINHDEICKQTAPFERHPFSADTAGKGAASGVPITRARARALLTQDADVTNCERDNRVSPNAVVLKDGSERRAPAQSPLAALSPSSGRRLACAGLRRREIAA